MSIRFRTSVKARRWAACVDRSDGVRVTLIRHEEEIVAAERAGVREEVTT